VCGAATGDEVDLWQINPVRYHDRHGRRIDYGTARPSALAIFRLYLVHRAGFCAFPAIVITIAWNR